MPEKPAYEELVLRIQELEQTRSDFCEADKALGASQDALRKSKDEMSAILDAAIETIALVDRKGIVITANHTACERVGLGKQDLIGHCLYDFFPPKVAQRRRRKYELVFDQGEPISFCDSRDGLLFEQTVYPIFGNSGCTEKVAIFARDITQSIRGEEALKQAYNIISKSPAVAFLWKKKAEGWPVQFVSDNVKALFGYTSEEFISGKVSYWETLHPDDRQRVALEMAGFGAKRDALNFVHKPYRILTKNKKVRWIDGRIFIRRDDEDRITHCEGIVVDVTERIKMTTALNESKEKYRSMMESTDDATYIGSSDYRITYMNPAMIKRVGYDAKGEHCYKVMHGLDAKCPWCCFKKVLRGKNVKYEVVSPKDGRTYHVSNSPISNTDGSVSKLTVFRDVTEMKEIESRLRQVQKVEAVGRLAGGVAHDLNNLLLPIIGYGELLLDNFEADDARQEAVKEILEAGLRARDLVRQLLAFARKQTLEYKPVNLNKVLVNFQKLLRRAIREDIEIGIFQSPQVSPVMVDVGQIEQVIMNLCLNAQDAMQDGGKITMETTMVEINEDSIADHPGAKAGQYVLLTVSDTGCGIDDKVKENIFEPFFSTKGERGTGLGLATVYGIVKQHGGNIWVYSELGVGTTFKVYLPVTARLPTESKTEEKPDVSLQGTETILLAEDNEQVRDLTYTILTRQGYTVLAAANGIEALKIIASYKRPVHLLLTDVVMPKMNGKELFSKISKKYPHLKVLYMSGYTANVIAHHGALEDGFQFIQKPFLMQALSVKLREILGEINDPVFERPMEIPQPSELLSPSR